MNSDTWDRVGQQIEAAIFRDVEKVINLYTVWQWAFDNNIHMQNTLSNGVVYARFFNTFQGEWIADIHEIAALARQEAQP